MKKILKASAGGLALTMAVLPCQAQSQITANDPLPTRVLACGGSIIATIGPRLEGEDLSSGYHVFLKNGGVTVDYETPAAVRKSKAGDHVLVCLVDIPKGCPPGDNRGRIYTVTNLRILESWTSSDSQHSCGGA